MHGFSGRVSVHSEGHGEHRLEEPGDHNNEVKRHNGEDNWVFHIQQGESGPHLADTGHNAASDADLAEPVRGLPDREPSAEAIHDDLLVRDHELRPGARNNASGPLQTNDRNHHSEEVPDGGFDFLLAAAGPSGGATELGASLEDPDAGLRLRHAGLLCQEPRYGFNLGFKVRGFVVSQKILQKLWELLPSRHKSVQLSLIRLFKQLVFQNDEVLLKYLVQNDLVLPIISLFLQQKHVNNLIYSSFLELFKFVISTNVKKLMIVIFEKHLHYPNKEKLWLQMKAKYENMPEFQPQQDNNEDSSIVQEVIISRN